MIVGIVDLWVGIEHLLPRVKRIPLSAESNVKIALHVSCGRVWQTIFLVVVAKEVLCWIPLEELKPNVK